MTALTTIKEQIQNARQMDETKLLKMLAEQAALSASDRRAIADQAAALVQSIRDESSPSLMESFLEQYGLSTKEGIALMCLAEALLRVPDDQTIDALIEDKITPSDWASHLGRSSSPLVNASTWALMFTGKLLEPEHSNSIGATLHHAVKRLGEPVVRRAVAQAMKEMGRQFVLGQNIGAAMQRAAKEERLGYTYSYDMLGEAARTEQDAMRFHLAYSDAITAIAKACTHKDIRHNPGISIKLSALHPRYESIKRQRVMEELVPRVRSLALLAKSAGMGLNIDAEEMDRLNISLDIIERVLDTQALNDWDGFGVVVQAYGRRANYVIDWLYALSKKIDRRIMVRLVKGAYWDSEIKLAQVTGVADYPVLTRKTSTDISYISIARKLLNMTDRIYPQFATHNAHTVCAVLHMAGSERESFEFQRLHGMGESVHALAKERYGARCRIYAPVGAHRDLLAYLVRRLLENGANSSFVNQIVDEDITPEEVAADPFIAYESYHDDAPHPNIPNPAVVFQPLRENSLGINILDEVDLANLEAARAPLKDTIYNVAPIINGKVSASKVTIISNPATGGSIGEVSESTAQDVLTALDGAKTWDASPSERRAILLKAADLFQRQSGEFFALACREAGKNTLDAVGELREAIDFLYYYANQAVEVIGNPRGIIGCISPWNFPLAIFTGQISAALAAGNAVIAKPAESTPIIAMRAVELLHEAGVPQSALQLVPGRGSVVGTALCSDERIAGICFTGSIQTAQIINRNLANHAGADALLIAETGGLNAMIVDSTALAEQAVRDILASSFQSAGQRCSALRILYVQEDIADNLLEMLDGAMDELQIDNPWDVSVDVGPVIDKKAQADIQGYIDAAKERGSVLKQLSIPSEGHFVTPAVLLVSGIADMEREIFGPVLHVCTFRADELNRVIDEINRRGFGLTFGLHTRIDDRVQHIVDRLHVGNMYVNRNQIGAIVASQPFGGEGLSGTGPKAGGPNYVSSFKAHERRVEAPIKGTRVDVVKLQHAIDQAKVGTVALNSDVMPGPTGESNRLSYFPKGVVLCCGPTLAFAQEQKNAVEAAGSIGIIIAPSGEIDGVLEPEQSADLEGFCGVHYWGENAPAKSWRIALAEREGTIIPLWCGPQPAHCYFHERHVCIDITSSGGNADLLQLSGK